LLLSFVAIFLLFMPFILWNDHYLQYHRYNDRQFKERIRHFDRPFIIK